MAQTSPPPEKTDDTTASVDDVRSDEAKRNRRREFLRNTGLATAAVAAGAATLPSLADSTTRIAAGSISDRKPPLPSLAVIALNRMAFGPRPGDVAAFNALGATDDARLTAYVDQQLDPDTITESDEFNQRMTAAGFDTLDKTLEQLWAEHRRNNYGEAIRPLEELERAQFIRAIFSEKQLQERMVEFWQDHFNIYGWSSQIAAVYVDLHRQLREHAFGNFRELLEIVASSTAMLYYLDNFTNERAGPNENWARELFELHTLGAEFYYGNYPQNDVPVDGDGEPSFYVDEDVYEATRCFTGWTVDDDTRDDGTDSGSFRYREDWHDRFQKRVLSSGINIPSDQAPMKDGRDVLDLVAFHHGTSIHICRKLCRRFIGDNPPEAIVNSAAAVFRNNSDQPDQMRRVMRHILLSDAFRSTWGEKVKRPFGGFVSFMRATQINFTFRLDHDTSGNFLWMFRNAGQSLFRWGPPDGYPDIARAWLGTSPRLQLMRLFNHVIDRGVDDVDPITTPDIDGNYYIDVLGQTSASARTARELVDFWTQRMLGRPMESAHRQELIEYMGQGINPDYDLPLDTDNDLQRRLRGLVALIGMSPDFQWK